MLPQTIEIEGDWRRIVQEAEKYQLHPLKLTVMPVTTGEAMGTVSEARVESRRVPIHERIAEIVAGVPDEEWAKLPSDLSDNLYHYIYGTPKRK